MTQTPSTRFPLPTLLAAGTFAAILLVVHYGFGQRKGMGPAVLRPVGEFHYDRSSLTPVVRVPLPGIPSVLAIPSPSAPGFSAARAANPTLESAYLFDSPAALDHFYAALQQSSEGHRDRPVRIIHYGDSPTTADLITGDARELLQQRFGDAGPGFVLIAKPWAWYGHHGVDVSGTGWKIDTAVGSMRESAYGLGGAIFTGTAGAVSTIRLQGNDSTSVEVEYLEQPGGGTLTVTADGANVGSVATSGDVTKNGASSITLPSGTRKVELTVSGGTVQVFGVALGQGSKGVTYDSIGLNGASTTVMSRAFNPENWGEALRHRQPDLLIINYGTNESGFMSFVDKQYEPELRRAIARVREALPETSILIMSPMDRGTRSDGGEVATMLAIPKIAVIQQRVAHETGCGFFNTYQAMGGDGTMARWYARRPQMVAADLIHPSPQGARIVAESLTGQLLIGYERYLQHHPMPPVGSNVVAKANAPQGVQ